MRRLIINADDFGLSPGVNRGIIEAHREGVVSSATLMATGPSFEDAAAAARSIPGLNVGCHVVLVDGEPVSQASAIASLLEASRNGNRPRLRRSIVGFASRSLAGATLEEHVQAEAEAQIRRLQSAGLSVSHVDTHKHAHIFPGVFRPLLRAARHCGVRAIRNPFVPVRAMAYAHLMRRPHLWGRYTQVFVLRPFCDSFRRQVQGEGLVTTDGTFGIVVTGKLDEHLFDAIVGSIPEGTWELVCHPGYCDDELRKVEKGLLESRETELRVLTSPAAKDALQRYGIELISYRELAAVARAEALSAD